MYRKFLSLILAAGLVCALLSGCGTEKIEQIKYEVSIEAGEEFEFDASEFFSAGDDILAEITLDDSELDIYTIGVYELTASYGGNSYVITASVADTTAPVIMLDTQTVYTNGTESTDIEISYEDATAVSVIVIDHSRLSDISPMSEDELESLLEEAYQDLEDSLDFELFETWEDTEDYTEGIYLSLAAARDEGGNVSFAGFITVYDTTAPVISGLSDTELTAEDVQQEPEYSLDGVTITDNFDGEADIEDSDVNFELTDEENHVWTLTVSYTDKAGNTASESCTYTVNEKDGESQDSSDSSSSSSSSGSGSTSSGSSSSSSSSSGSSSSGSSSSTGSGSSSSSSSSSGSSSSGSSSSSSSSGSSSSSSSGSSSSGSSSSGSSSSSSSSSNGYNDTYAYAVLELVNEERAAEGFSALTMNSAAMAAAKVRAAELVENFSHYRPDGSLCITALDEAGVSYTTAGENIACGQTSASQVVSSWMNSEGHRANILGESFTQIGIGCYYYDGVYYWVQLFIG